MPKSTRSHRLWPCRLCWIIFTGQMSMSQCPCMTGSVCQTRSACPIRKKPRKIQRNRGRLQTETVTLKTTMRWMKQLLLPQNVIQSVSRMMRKVPVSDCIKKVAEMQQQKKRKSQRMRPTHSHSLQPTGRCLWKH